MPQFGEERGDGKSYGGDNLPKGGGGGQNEVSCSGGRQDDQCRFGRRRHQDPSLQRCTTPGAADAKECCRNYDLDQHDGNHGGRKAYPLRGNNADIQTHSDSDEEYAQRQALDGSEEHTSDIRSLIRISYAVL